jgi:hypothetical protein
MAFVARVNFDVVGFVLQLGNHLKAPSPKTPNRYFSPNHFKICLLKPSCKEILNSICFPIWRYFWTLPGRKSCMRSSSFSSTITIPNFEPLSVTVREFWKRYHQKTKFPVISDENRAIYGGSKFVLHWKHNFRTKSF